MNCYVLTGGLSSRMKRDKRELQIRGRRFLDLVAGAAAPVFDEVVEVRRSLHSEATLRAIVEPDHEGTSPLYGIRAALADATTRAWILAVDYPLITAPVLQILRDRFDESDADLLVPMWEGRPQMLCAGWSVSLLVEIQQRIEEENLRLRGLLDRPGVCIIPERWLRQRFPGEPLMNVNRPEQLESIRRTMGG